jgi:hypothetical protein
MRRTIFSALVFVLLSGAFGATQAKAGGQVSLYAGYLNPGELNLDNVQESLELQGTSLYGARFEFDFLKNVLGIEQNISFSPRLFSSTLFPEEAEEIRGLLYSSNLVVNIPVGRFVPYVTGGIGFIKPWGSRIDPFDTTFAGNYGGGVKLNRLAGPVGLRFDVRGWRTGDIVNQSLNIFEASGAVTFTW